MARGPMRKGAPRSSRAPFRRAARPSAEPECSAALAALLDGQGELFENGHSGVESDARVCDADAVFERLVSDDVLATSTQVTLDHDPHQSPVATCDLRCQVSGHPGLILVVLLAVGVACIHHHASIDARLFE